MTGKAHQRLIREQEAARNPRAVVPLTGCRVERVDQAWAAEIIHRYEWLGTMNRPLVCYGLLSETSEPLGVACFGMPGGSNSLNICGPEWRDRTICLERGACVHFAHPHAASFLITRAVKLLGQEHKIVVDDLPGFSPTLKSRYVVVFAYSDSAAGEIGTVYQACNWLYLGVGNGRPGHRWKGRLKGSDKWMSSKAIRSMLRAQGLPLGPATWKRLKDDPDWEFTKEFPKGRYVTFTGTFAERRKARKALRYPVQLYPKRSEEES